MCVSLWFQRVQSMVPGSVDPGPPGGQAPWWRKHMADKGWKVMETDRGRQTETDTILWGRIVSPRMHLQWPTFSS